MALNKNNFNCGMNVPNININNMNNINNMMNIPLSPNICMNNMNPFSSFFPINPAQNMQNFNNLGMLINQMNQMHISNNVNNFGCINNFNAQNNFPYKKFNSCEIKPNMSINDFNEDIEFNFSFVNSTTFKIKANKYEILKDVIYKFKMSECPEDLKKSLTVGLFNANKVDKNKTLKELGIQNGDKILFMPNNQPKQEKVVYTERENEQYDKLRNLYKNRYPNKENNKDGNEADDEGDEINHSVPKFKHFVMSIDNSVGITVNEHKHRLVLCLTNESWTCNICNLKYKKEVERYYCSLCDYSMCKNCHYSKKYFMKKSFPKGVKPSNDSVQAHFLNTPFHNDRLVFCRSSRNFLNYNKWNCDNCRELFDNDQWSFYCTACDFDLCCDCCGFH